MYHQNVSEGIVENFPFRAACPPPPKKKLKIERCQTGTLLWPAYSPMDACREIVFSGAVHNEPCPAPHVVVQEPTTPGLHQSNVGIKSGSLSYEIFEPYLEYSSRNRQPSWPNVPNLLIVKIQDSSGRRIEFRNMSISLAQTTGNNCIMAFSLLVVESASSDCNL